MTPNGTLLAHSEAKDSKELRKQVAVAALSWQEQDQGASNLADSVDSHQPAPSRGLQVLIIESALHNVLVRRLQSQLLLVLEGGVPPRKSSFETRITAEGSDGQPLHDTRAGDSSLSTSVSSKAESSMSMASSGVLALHRKKLDAMSAAILADFEQTGFKMPEDASNHFF